MFHGRDIHGYPSQRHIDKIEVFEMHMKEEKHESKHEREEKRKEKKAEREARHNARNGPQTQ